MLLEHRSFSIFQNVQDYFTIYMKHKLERTLRLLCAQVRTIAVEGLQQRLEEISVVDDVRGYD